MEQQLREIIYLIGTNVEIKWVVGICLGLLAINLAVLGYLSYTFFLKWFVKINLIDELMREILRVAPFGIWALTFTAFQTKHFGIPIWLIWPLFFSVFAVLSMPVVYCMYSWNKVVREKTIDVYVVMGVLLFTGVIYISNSVCRMFYNF